jgi:hypothetical protein
MRRALSLIPLRITVVFFRVVVPPSNGSLIVRDLREDGTIRRRGKFLARTALDSLRIHDQSLPLSARHRPFMVGRAAWVLGYDCQVLPMRS